MSKLDQTKTLLQSWILRAKPLGRGRVGFNNYSWQPNCKKKKKKPKEKQTFDIETFLGK